ncbi:MAG: four helix bundle protein [Patescibacteria group bacterium]|nr:four helix bundle protein [Patescibacteria group bacterium]
MIENTNNKQYNLEDRTFEFAKKVRMFVKNLPRTISNIEYAKQLIRSSGSVGANYIEANESFSKKDFVLRVKISKKETKESRYWLRLIDTEGTKSLQQERLVLIKETEELMKIFGAIIEKSK